MRTRTILASCLAVCFIAAMVSAQCVPPMPLGTTEGFESMGQDTTSTAGCGAAPAPLTTLPAGWSHGDLPAPFPPPPAGAAATNWFRSDSGGTPSGGTGPTTDVTTGTGSGIYLYLETSGGCGSTIAYLNAPPMDASGVANPAVEFWYHMQGTTMGTLKVEAFDGVNWITLWSLAGDQGDAWHFVQVPLTVFNTGATQQCVTEILFRFVGIGGGGFTSDMAIDEVRFGEATPPKFDTNTPGATATIDGVSGDEFFPTIITKTATLTPCVTIPATGTAEISTSNNPGATFEVVLSSAPVVALGQPGALSLGPPSNAIVNLNIFQPLTFMLGGTTLNFQPFPGSNFPGWTGGSVVIPFAITTAPQTVSMQAVITNASAPGGFELSQATQMDVASASNAPGPAGDEVSVALDVVNPPFCWTTGGVPFYGTLYTTIYMQSNGRLRFDSGLTDFSPTVAEAQNDIMMGLWADMDTSAGSVFASSPATGVVRVDYVNVAYFAGPPAHTYAYEIDSNTGNLTFDGLTGLDLTQPAASDVFLGISPGGGAADPGTTVFTAGSGIIPGGNNAVLTYDFGLGALPASIDGVLNQIIFYPNSTSGYDYEGL